MLRLRTTTSLSALALAIGIAGSAWLCTLTAGWAGPSAHAVAVARTQRPSRHVPRHASHLQRWHGPVSVLAVRHTRPSSAVAGAVVVRSAPALIPLSTPDDLSQPWYLRRDHLNGRVLVHLQIGARGEVIAARVAESSGDRELDQHALRSVRGWRFQVPADWPEGFSGDLPMRFAAASERLASVP